MDTKKCFSQLLLPPITRVYGGFHGAVNHIPKKQIKWSNRHEMIKQVAKVEFNYHPQNIFFGKKNNKCSESTLRKENSRAFSLSKDELAMNKKPIILLDVMGTIVRDPFFKDMPAFFG